MDNGGKTKVITSAARNLGKNPLLLLPRNAKTLTAAVGGLLSLSGLISPDNPISQAGGELNPSLAGLLNLAEPLISHASPGSDLSFDIGELGRLSSEPESGETSGNLPFFLEAASTLVPLAAGRRRSRSVSSSSSSSDSTEFDFDIHSASRHIYFPKFRAKNHLWHLPNLHKATLDIVQAVWKLYYKSASSSEFERKVAAANHIIQQALGGYVSSTRDKSIDPEFYGQVRVGHFLAVRTALDSVTDRLTEIQNGDYHSKRTVSIIQGCGRQLLHIQEVSEQVAHTSGAISDFVFDRVRYLAFSFLVLHVEKALAILHNLQYALVNPDNLCLAKFLCTLYKCIDEHHDAATIKRVKNEILRTSESSEFLSDNPEFYNKSVSDWDEPNKDDPLSSCSSPGIASDTTASISRNHRSRRMSPKNLLRGLDPGNIVPEGERRSRSGSQSQSQPARAQSAPPSKGKAKKPEVSSHLEDGEEINYPLLPPAQESTVQKRPVRVGEMETGSPSRQGENDTRQGLEPSDHIRIPGGFDDSVPENDLNEGSQGRGEENRRWKGKDREYNDVPDPYDREGKEKRRGKGKGRLEPSDHIRIPGGFDDSVPENDLNEGSQGRGEENRRWKGKDREYNDVPDPYDREGKEKRRGKGKGREYNDSPSFYDRNSHYDRGGPGHYDREGEEKRRMNGKGRGYNDGPGFYDRDSHYDRGGPGRYHKDGYDSYSDSAFESEIDKSGEGSSESADDSVEEVMPSTERTQYNPRTRSLQEIERSMGKSFPSMNLTDGVVVGWNWVGRIGTRVCVLYRKGGAQTGRVEAGSLHSFEKSAATNIAAQMQSNVQNRSTEDASMSEPYYNKDHVKGLGTVFWDAGEASDPLSVLQPSKQPGTVYPWIYIEVEWKHTKRITLEPRWTLPRLLKKSKYWVACMIYSTAEQQERAIQKALWPRRKIPKAVLPSDPYTENPYSRRRRSLSMARKAVEDQTDSDESEYLADEEAREEEEEEEYKEGEEKGRQARSKTHDSGYASVEPAGPASYRKDAPRKSDREGSRWRSQSWNSHESHRSRDNASPERNFPERRYRSRSSIEEVPRETADGRGRANQSSQPRSGREYSSPSRYRSSLRDMWPQRSPNSATSSSQLHSRKSAMKDSDRPRRRDRSVSFRS
ncbi:hypothetical protein EPUS_09306 [Endocarpon pusillum Z07020]|uniref:Uncharacterized protein n=1 Tax=Endocarpon pusillum (strain Z07020 / HMAS-L-300199) TaxID=1263415 RepID=U1I0V6_ENDPU|nr:uncharacterized protein EPUS_09306 [Endocarpon pusillum Z07020]ERF75519.1 hypothetical protein EPUS_09306 [Endocarpon pusillum Z07020]